MVKGELVDIFPLIFKPQGICKSRRYWPIGAISNLSGLFILQFYGCFCEHKYAVYNVFLVLKATSHLLAKFSPILRHNDQQKQRRTKLEKQKSIFTLQHNSLGKDSNQKPSVKGKTSCFTTSFCIIILLYLFHPISYCLPGEQQTRYLISWELPVSASHGLPVEPATLRFCTQQKEK